MRLKLILLVIFAEMAMWGWYVISQPGCPPDNIVCISTDQIKALYTALILALTIPVILIVNPVFYGKHSRRKIFYIVFVLLTGYLVSLALEFFYSKIDVFSWLLEGSLRFSISLYIDFGWIIVLPYVALFFIKKAAGVLTLNFVCVASYFLFIPFLGLMKSSTIAIYPELPVLGVAQFIIALMALFINRKFPRVINWVVE